MTYDFNIIENIPRKSSISTEVNTIVQMLPSPDSILEDEFLRQKQGEERFTKAAEQNKSKIGRQKVKEDLIGPQPR